VNRDPSVRKPSFGLSTLVTAEIRSRTWGFVAVALSVLVPVSAVLLVLVSLEHTRTELQAELGRLLRDTQKRTESMRADVDQALLRVGMAVTLDQDLVVDLPSDLLGANASTVPVLRCRTQWPETGWPVIVTGLGPGATVADLDFAPPEPGAVVIGYDLHRHHNLLPGESLTLLGRGFRVQACLPARDLRDNITLWLTLDDAQSVLELEGRVTEFRLRGLSCAPEQLPTLGRELERAIPSVRAVTDQPRALAAALGSLHAAREEAAAVVAEQRSRLELLDERRTFAIGLLTVVVLGCGLWLAILSTLHARRRLSEVAILQTLGLGHARVLTLILAHTGLAATLGTVLGLALATTVTAARIGHPGLRLPLVLGTLVLTPLLAVICAAVPAWWATNRDPAALLTDRGDGSGGRM
jgi:hypothetical protein